VTFSLGHKLAYSAKRDIEFRSRVSILDEAWR